MELTKTDHILDHKEGVGSICKAEMHKLANMMLWVIIHNTTLSCFIAKKQRPQTQNQAYSFLT